MEGGGSLTSASCKGSFQNASRLNPEEVLTHDVQSTLVTNAQGNKCEWICNPGYIKKDNTCQEVSGSCIGTFLNAHRVNEHEQLTTNIPSKLVRAETGKPCEWKCNEGYQYFGGHFPACKIRTYQCIGAEPAHAELILGDDKGLEEDTQRILVETASSRKCEYRCKAGYKLKNGKCKPVVKPVCKGKFPGGYDYNFIPSCLKVDQTLGTGKTAWANFSFGTIKCSKKQWETSGDCFDPKNITLFNTDTLNQSFCEVGSVDTQSLLNAYLSLNPNGDLSLKPDLDGFSHFNSFSNLGTATPSNGSLSAPPVGRRNASLGLSLLSESGGYGRDFPAISESLVAQSLCLWPHGMEDRYKFSALRNGPKPKLTYTCKNDGEEVTCPLRVRDPELTEIRGRVNPNKEVGFYVACKDGRLNNNGTCSICNTDAVSHPFTGNEELYCSNLGRASNYSYQKNSPTKIESWKYDNVNQKNVRTTQTIKVDKWEWTCKTHIGDSQQCLALKGEFGITNCFVSRMGGVTCLDVSRFDQHDNGGDGGFPGDPGSFNNGFGGNNNSKWSY